MPRSVVDVVLEGSGIRISWSDNLTDQYIWNQVGNIFALRNAKSGEELSISAVNEIINSLQFGFNSETLWSHFFGLAGGHLSAAAITQIGDSLVADTWTRIIYDEARVEAESSGISIDNATGIVTFAGGEWNINGVANLHKTSSSSIDFMIQLWDEDLAQEVPRTFRIRSTAAKVNAPASLRLATILDANALPSKRVSIRIRVDASDAVLGSLTGNIPSGSTNSAGLLTITRLG